MSWALQIMKKLKLPVVPLDKELGCALIRHDHLTKVHYDILGSSMHREVHRLGVMPNDLSLSYRATCRNVAQLEEPRMAWALSRTFDINVARLCAKLMRTYMQVPQGAYIVPECSWSGGSACWGLSKLAENKMGKHLESRRHLL